MLAQIRFSLSSSTKWDRVTKAEPYMHYPSLYYFIVDLFEADPEDEWAIETLAWLDK